MDFKQAEDRFKQLKAQFAAGRLSEPEFKAQLEELMIQDEQGGWWMIGYETERWYRHDGTSWVQTDPPGSLTQKPTPLATPDPKTTEAISAENENQEEAGKLVREKIEQKAEGKADTDKKAGRKSQTIFLEAKQRLTEKSTWRFGRREILATIAGIFLLYMLGWFFSINRPPLSTLFYGTNYGTSFDPRNAIVLFFGLLFGPMVGFIVGLLGSSTGIFFHPKYGFELFFYYVRNDGVWILLLILLLRGLMGIIMGFAKSPSSEIFSNRSLLRTGLFVLFAFILIVFISIFGAGPYPNYPVSILINQWLRFPNRFETMIVELVFTFIYLAIFMYTYFQISKFIPGIIPAGNSRIEKTAREGGKSMADDVSASFTHSKIQKSDIVKRGLFQSWWRRSLLGGIIGLILGITPANSYGGAPLLVSVIACGLAGLITYPHKLSIAFLLLGFFVAGFIANPQLNYAEDFLIAGAILGVPAGALLSRILHWAKVLK